MTHTNRVLQMTVGLVAIVHRVGASRIRAEPDAASAAGDARSVRGDCGVVRLRSLRTPRITRPTYRVGELRTDCRSSRGATARAPETVWRLPSFSRRSLHMDIS